MFLKRIAEKLGVFHIAANFIECDTAPQGVVDAAAYLCSVLTVLSIEMTEKALPVVPGVLARINAGVETVAPVPKWYARSKHVVVNLSSGWQLFPHRVCLCGSVCQSQYVCDV